MRGFAKGLTLCLLLLSLLVTTVSAAPFENCPGGCSHQAAIGATHYDTLSEAIAAANAGAGITLLTDASTGPLVITKPLALDLGDKTLSGSPADGQALVSFTAGGALRGGRIAVTSGSALAVSGCTVSLEKDAVLEGCGAAPALLVRAGKDTAARVNISAELLNKGAAPVIDAVSEEGSCEIHILKNAKLTAQKNLILNMDCAGKLNISGGNLLCQKDMLRVAVAEKRAFEIAVTDGRLLSDEGAVIQFTKKDEKALIPGNFITGGTYYRVPTAYVPAYCRIRDNADSTYTVISAYTLTFQANGGSGVMSPLSVRCGSSCTLPECGFTAPAGKDFKGWQIGNTTYAPGSSYTPTADTAVTALWGAHVHTGGKATCLKKAVCSVCGESYGTLGRHDLRAAGAYAPTCTADGVNAHKRCATCGKRFVNGEQVSLSDLTMPALGHLWQQTDGKPADCLNDGILAHERCANCGLLQAEGQPITQEELVIPAGGHKLEDVAKVEATCTQAGVLAHQRCSVCDLVLISGKPADASQLATGTASHVLSDWHSDETGHWKTCVDCGEEFRRSGHKLTDGVCSECGYEADAAEEAPGKQQERSFSWLFLIPIIAALGIAGALAVTMFLKSRK